MSEKSFARFRKISPKYHTMSENYNNRRDLEQAFFHCNKFKELRKMQVKSQEFVGKYAGLEVISNNDTGLFAVQYSEPEKMQAPEIGSMRNSYYDCNTKVIELRISQPKQRKVLRSLIVVKSSANCYRVGYADAKGAEQFVARTYNEIHWQLDSLWKRK